MAAEKARLKRSEGSAFPLSPSRSPQNLKKMPVNDRIPGEAKPAEYLIGLNVELPAGFNAAHGTVLQTPGIEMLLCGQPAISWSERELQKQLSGSFAKTGLQT